MNFRFRSKSRPINYTCSVVSNMQLYPPEHTLSGPSLHYTFDPAAITEVLDQLVPENMLLTTVSRTFEGKTDLKEEWYSTDYFGF